jgi:Holliday junction DNA helicase RuvB
MRKIQNLEMKHNDAQHMLKGLIESAQSRRQVLEYILLCRLTSSGNKPLRSVVSQIKGVTLHVVSASTLPRGGDIAAILTHLQTADILLIDEIHRLSTPCIRILSHCMENSSLHIEVGKEPNKKEIDLSLPQFTVIGTTSQPNKLTENMTKCFQKQIWIDD